MNYKRPTRVSYRRDGDRLTTTEYYGNGSLYKAVIDRTKNTWIILKSYNGIFKPCIASYANTIPKCKISIRKELLKLGVNFDDDIRGYKKI